MTGSGSSSRNYDIDDPIKIQGRDEVSPSDRNLAGMRLRRALDSLPDESGTILMPGAGAGRYARAVAHLLPECDVIAGDLSAAAVQEAISLGGGPSYSHFDAADPPFSGDSFDAIVFFDLLEHVPDPGKLIRGCYRMLRPGGVLHFFVPLEAQPITLYALFDDDRPIPIHRWKWDHVGHIQRFRCEDVFRFCWDSGFHVLGCSYSFHTIGQAHDIVDYWHRERSRGGKGRIPVVAVNFVARMTMFATWRLSYLEDRTYDGQAFASGLHVTARRPPLAQC